MTRRAHAAAALALAVALAGCSDPYVPADPHGPARPTAAPTRVPGELPGRIPQRDRAALNHPQTTPAATADAALQRYARLLTNWRADTVSARYRQAAGQAVGQARRDAEQTAASAARDAQLIDAGTTSRGETIAVIPQRSGWALVVTREQLSPDAGPVRYRVYRAHTRRVSGGVAVDAWEPQP
jgi:hypothetical protein